MRIRGLMAILASGSLLVLAACGGSGGSGSGGGSVNSLTVPSAASLESDAAAALKSAQSVKLSGSATDKGQVVKIDLDMFRSGAESGSVSAPYAGRSDIAFNLITTGSAAYILVDKQFFNAVLRPTGLPASACATFAVSMSRFPRSNSATST